MSEVLAHLQENMTAYIAGAVCLIPILIITRKWSLPLIQFAVEIVIYSGIVHGILHFLVALAKWFKGQTEWKGGGDAGEAVIPWGTPLTEFWKMDLYSPKFLFYFEVMCFVAIVWAVWTYRPMQIQRSLRKKEDEAPKPGSRYSAKKTSSYSKGRRR